MRFLLHRRRIPTTLSAAVANTSKQLLWKDTTSTVTRQQQILLFPEKASPDNGGSDVVRSSQNTPWTRNIDSCSTTSSTTVVLPSQLDDQHPREESSSKDGTSSLPSTSSIRAWGQQCSEHCGCAIRFEMTMDPTTQVITSAHFTTKQLVGSRQQRQPQPRSLVHAQSLYQQPQLQNTTSTTTASARAKAIWNQLQAARNTAPFSSSSSSSSSSSQSTTSWQPQFTFGQEHQQHVDHQSPHCQHHIGRPRRRRPLVTSCSCSTLHQLALQVTEYLPRRTLDQIRNELEFTLPRSSLAVSHTILRQQQLPVTDTHCWDVLEEALTGMIKGYLPRPRTTRVPNPMFQDTEDDNDDDDGDDNHEDEPMPQQQQQQQPQQRMRRQFGFVKDVSKWEEPLQPQHTTSSLLLDRHYNYYNNSNNSSSDDKKSVYSDWGINVQDDKSSSSSSPSPMDMLYSMSPSLQHQIHNIRRPHRRNSTSYYDWVSYVDELRYREDEEERSA